MLQSREIETNGKMLQIAETAGRMKCCELALQNQSAPGHWGESGVGNIMYANRLLFYNIVKVLYKKNIVTDLIFYHPVK